MTENVVLTDPARELAELCAVLCVPTSKAGEQFLASHFEVEPWSREFFQIVFTISERCSLLQDIVEDLDLDQDVKDELRNSINDVMLAFSAESMRQAWEHGGYVRLALHNIRPIKTISGLVRQKVAYRKLSDDEVTQLLEEVSGLLGWLREHQLAEQDFIRQAIIEGLEQLYFRLERLNWLGWGYTLNSLRDVIGAYMLLERGLDPAASPDAEAVLKKVGAVIKKLYEKVGVVKDVTDTGDWLLRAYGAGSLIYQAAPTATLLLGSGGN